MDTNGEALTSQNGAMLSNGTPSIGSDSLLAGNAASSEQADTIQDPSSILDTSEMNDESDIESMRKRIREMEEEAEKLKQMQLEVDKQIGTPVTPTGTSQFPTFEEKMEADVRSVYVGNVDYSATAQELENHFHGCGSIHRVTILCDKFSGHPKGFAYVEFADKDSVQTAIALDDSLFKGRQIKVTEKRTNRPGFSMDRGRGRGGFGRGRFPRGGLMVPGGYMAGGYIPAPYRGRIARPYFRGRGRSSYFYTPY